MEELKDLRQRLHQLTDEELLTIATTEAADYRKEAVDFAKAELRTRGVPLEKSSTEEPAPDEDTPESLDTHGLGCTNCGGRLRHGTLVAEKELTIVFSENSEERGQISMLVDLKTDVEGG